MTITGAGKLTVTGNQNDGEGIATEAQDMTISGSVEIYITSKDDGLNAGGDGGQITISDNAVVVVNAQGDGIDSNKNAVISGGTIYTTTPSTSENAAIDTDDGYVINGGTVVALGTNMPETPLTTSTQVCLCFNLDSSVAASTVVVLLDSDSKVVLAFKSTVQFQTLIMSSSAFAKGKTYTLYSGGTLSGATLSSYNIYTGDSITYTAGTQLAANSANTFTTSTSSTVNTFGSFNSGGGPGHEAA